MSSLISPGMSSVIKSHPGFPGGGGGQTGFLVSASSQWPSAQNNYYVQLAYLG